MKWYIMYLIVILNSDGSTQTMVLFEPENKYDTQEQCDAVEAAKPRLQVLNPQTHDFKVRITRACLWQ
jgi:hypothetical protein